MDGMGMIDGPCASGDSRGPLGRAGTASRGGSWAWFRVWGSGFGVQGLGFRVWGSGFGV